MNIEITHQEHDEVCADTLAHGRYAVKKHGTDGDLIVVRSWGGLTSLDGQHRRVQKSTLRIVDCGRVTHDFEITCRADLFPVRRIIENRILPALAPTAVGYNSGERNRRHHVASDGR